MQLTRERLRAVERLILIALFFSYLCCKARAITDSLTPLQCHGPLELFALDRRRRRRCSHAPSGVPSWCLLKPNFRRIRSFCRRTDESSRILEERQTVCDSTLSRDCRRIISFLSSSFLPCFITFSLFFFFRSLAIFIAVAFIWLNLIRKFESAQLKR